jgi:hypothetical protein
VSGLFALAVVGSAADLTGKVVLKGKPRNEIKINLSPDPRCAALHTEPIFTRHYVLGEGNGLANVFVYLKEGVEKKDWPMPTEKPVLDQVGCEYTPYVMGVRVNQKFTIKNSDPTLHNVHATPNPKGGNKEFNFAQPLKGMTTEKSFPAPEVAVRFKCDVHPWMFAYVAVVEHPFFAVTDKNGNFKIKDVPPGEYTVEAWHVKTHRGKSGVAQKVTVDGNTVADFTIDIQ